MNTGTSLPWRTIAPLGFGLALAGLILFGLWPKPLIVDTAQIRSGPMTVTVAEEGKTRIRARHLVFAPVSGFLQRPELRAGDPILASRTVLARIVPEPAGILNPRAKAEAEARLRTAETVIRVRQADLGRAQANLDLARKDHARMDALLRAEAVSRQDWDTTNTRLQVARKEEQAARFALNVAGFEAEQAQAGLLQTSSPPGNDARIVTILAPVDGCVLKVYEENARTVTPATAIMEVGDPRDLEIEIEMLSSDAVAVAPGASVMIEDWGGPAPLHGQVRLVERGAFTKVSAIGVEEQRVKVLADLLDPVPAGYEPGDRFGLLARVTTWHGPDVTQIPVGALFRQGMDWKVFVVENGKARLRGVDIGHANGLSAELRSGPGPGDIVIVHPPENLREGMRVRVEEN